MGIVSLLQVLSSSLWLGLVALVVFAVYRKMQGQKIKNITTILIVILVFAIVGSVVSAGLVFIEPTELGIVISIMSGGMRQEALSPGLTWIIPFAESVITYPTDRQTYTMSIVPEEGQVSRDDSIEARTADGQIVLVDASIIFQIDPTKAVDVHKKWKGEYIEKLIRPISRGVIRDAVSQYGVEEIYSSKRLELTNTITEKIEYEMSEGGLILVNFVLRNITFSDEYNASVEAKQIAEQQAQQAKFVVETKIQEAEQARQTAQGAADAAVIAAEADAKAVIINAEAAAEARRIGAEAESEALRLLGSALKAYPDVLTLQYIEKISPNVDVMMIPSDNPYILQIPNPATK